MSAWKFDYTWWAYGDDWDYQFQATNIHNAKHFHGFDAIVQRNSMWETEWEKEENESVRNYEFINVLPLTLLMYVLGDWACM